MSASSLQVGPSCHKESPRGHGRRDVGVATATGSWLMREVARQSWSLWGIAREGTSLRESQWESPGGFRVAVGVARGVKVAVGVANGVRGAG